VIGEVASGSMSTADALLTNSTHFAGTGPTTFSFGREIHG